MILIILRIIKIHKLAKLNIQKTITAPNSATVSSIRYRALERLIKTYFYQSTSNLHIHKHKKSLLFLEFIETIDISIFSKLTAELETLFRTENRTPESIKSA